MFTYITQDLYFLLSGIHSKSLQISLYLRLADIALLGFFRIIQASLKCDYYSLLYIITPHPILHLLPILLRIFIHFRKLRHIMFDPFQTLYKLIPVLLHCAQA